MEPTQTNVFAVAAPYAAPLHVIDHPPSLYSYTVVLIDAVEQSKDIYSK